MKLEYLTYHIFTMSILHIYLFGIFTNVIHPIQIYLKNVIEGLLNKHCESYAKTKVVMLALKNQ